MADILIIDDDVELTENLSVFLKEDGHTVRSRTETDNAVKALIEAKPDLLILDVMFPDDPVAGFDLARKIRHTPALASMPVLMLTGVNQHFPMDFSSSDIDDEWLPVHDFVEKTAGMETVVRKANALLGSD